MQSSVPELRTTVTYLVPKAEHDHIRQLFGDLGVVNLDAGPYETWRVRLSDLGSHAVVVLYKSGKLVISGKAPAFDDASAVVESVPGSVVTPRNGRGTSALLNASPAPAERDPHIGTDEAGKGDFFGPLVTAGVYVEGKSAELLRTLGVRDSKKLSDAVVRSLAREIRLVTNGKSAVTVLNPKRYNDLYEQMRREGKNLNVVLAWAHGRVIENLVQAGGIHPKFILSDQFGDKSYLEKRLQIDTRQAGIPLIQMPRAEADVAVAAASILARDAFLAWFERTSKTLGLRLPKGASPQVVQAARVLVDRIGRDNLREYAKVSFKTMEKVLAP